MIVSVVMETPIVVLAVALLALHRIGHLEVLAVGLIMVVMVMIMILEVVLEVLVVVVVFLVIEENHHLAILVALVPMGEGLVGVMVAVA